MEAVGLRISELEKVASTGKAIIDLSGSRCLKKTRSMYSINAGEGLPDFFGYDTKTGKNVPTEHKTYQMVI
jgi:hypothetical protein